MSISVPSSWSKERRQLANSKSALGGWTVSYSSVAFAHHEVQTAQNRGHVAYHATGQKFRKNAQVHKGWRTNFQPMRDASSFAVDVEPQLAFGIFRGEINFARRGIRSLGYYNEMMDQFLHLCHDLGFRRHHAFPIRNIDRTVRQLIDDLPQDSDALAHFFDPHQVAIVTITGAADHNFEIVVLVIEIRMFAPQIVLDSAAAQIRSRKRIRNRAIFRDHTDVFCSIDKNFVPSQQLIAF